MMPWPNRLEAFSNIWVVDFEFRCPDGERPTPHCMVAKSHRTGETKRMWLHNDKACPFTETDLVVAYYASAEAGCFLALGWDLRLHFLDLFVEFKNHMGGRSAFKGSGLLGACSFFKIQTRTSSESKQENRTLAQQSDFTESEKVQLLDYCQSDVECTADLLVAMLPTIDLPRALLRGRYMKAAAAIERNGIPIDLQNLEKIRVRWPANKAALVEAIDRNFGVYDGVTFKVARWRGYCAKNRMAWPTLPTGEMDLQDGTFRAMASLYPEIQPIRELRATLSQMKLGDLRVGADARNRYLLSAFQSLTGRNQPSNTKAIYGAATWIRHLIKPPKGMAVAYLDYEQQEHGIAASLSGDKNMKDAYLSGDPYMAFAKQAKAVPQDATKKTHPNERDLYKATALAVQYGMGAESLSLRIGKSKEHGRALLEHHRSVYPAYWWWSDAMATRGMLGLPLATIFGWRTLGKGDGNPRTFRNFPAQANGAEMLRLAIIALVESGIHVCAPVHDAVLIEGAVDEIDQLVETAQAIMEAASRAVLGDFTIRTDAKVVKYPDRYDEPRGAEMWGRLSEILGLSDVAGSDIECSRLLRT